MVLLVLMFELDIVIGSPNKPEPVFGSTHRCEATPFFPNWHPRYENGFRAYTRRCNGATKKQTTLLRMYYVIVCDHTRLAPHVPMVIGACFVFQWHGYSFTRARQERAVMAF